MKFIRIVRLVGAIAVLCGCAFGQSITGTLQGTVQDPSGGVVPDAKVVIKGAGTGVTRNAVTGSDGVFIFNAVDPETYNLTITAKAGFKVYDEQNIVLTANERRDLGKIVLTIGSVTESISVTATATPLQTSSGENSKLIEASQLENITIKGRDVFEILETIPGVSFGNALLQGSGADATSNASGTFGSLQINGGGTARTNFIVDGVGDVDNGNNSQVDFEPTMDTIAEIRVLTSNYQAEFGHSSSGQISVITKGGSASFHGSAFFNKRHEMFNAKDFFTNLNGNQKTISRFGVYGYTIGGPVFIPKVFNVKKNKLFFFFSQEYTKLKPASTTQEAMVPTAAQLQGNFYDRCLVNTGVNGVACVPGYTDNNGADKSTLLLNPAAGKTTLAGGNLNQLVGTSAYNAASAAIGQAMLKYLPLPNLCTAAAGIYNGMAISPTNCPSGFSSHAISNPSWNYGDNYIWTANEIHPRRNDTARIDWNISDRNRAFVRYSQDYDADLTNFGIPVKDTSGNYSPTAANFNKPGHGWAVGVTSTLSSNMVNEFTFGKIFNGIGYYEANDAQVQRANMGNPPSFDNFATDPLFKNDGQRWLAGTGPLNYADYVPSLTFGDSAGRSETAPSTNPCWNGCPYTNKADSWTFADNLTRVVGKHNLKAGVYVERTFKVQDGSQGNYLGSYNFSNDSSGQNPLDTQDGFANAWLGNYKQYSEGQKNIGDWKFWQVEFFLQDSWRVTPRLTLDLGLRFSAMPPITNVGTGRNASAEFVASAYNNSQAERLYIGECVNPTTNAIVSTANGPCPGSATTKAYDPVTGTFGISSLVGTFVPNSVANYPTGATPYPGMLVAGTDPRLPQGLYKVPFLSPAGRFGFAWDVFGKGRTAIRGGIGQFLNRLSYNQIASPVSFPPILQSLNLYYGNITNISSGAASLGALSPGSMNADFTGHQTNESTYNGSLQIQQKIGFSSVLEASWVFELRRHVPLNIPLDYFPLFSQFNNGAAWVNPTTAYLQNNTLTGYQGGNSGLGLLPNQNLFSPSVCPTCVSGYSGISAQAFEGTSNYNALQINVRRNMTKHFSYGYAFTWDKSMGPGAAGLNNGDPGFSRDPLLPDKYRNWGPSYSPTPFYFTINSVYEIPGLGDKVKGFKPVGWVTDHWVLSGLYQWRSDQMTGIPTPGFSNTSSSCSSAATCYPMWNWTGGSESFRAVVTGDYRLSSTGGTIQINPAASTAGTNSGSPSTNSYPLNGSPSNQLINTAVFTIPFPCSQFPAADPHYGVGENLSCLGNAGSGQLLNIPGTRVSNLDMTLTKNFPLKHEGRSLQFRAEAYNVPNHTQFSGYNITPQYDWRNWLQGRLVQTSSTLNRMTSTLNPRQMEMSLRLVF